MHDSNPDSLRKQTLKHNGKTLSRKAQAKLTSLTPSAAGSSPNSKNVSRASSAGVSRANSEAGWPGSRPDSRMGSSDEEGPSLSMAYVAPRLVSPTYELTCHSNLSLTEMLESELQGGSDDDPWAESFTEELEHLVNNNFWKNSNPQLREQALVGYARGLLARYAPESLEPFADGMVSLLKKVIKAEDTANSTVLALKGLALTMITLPSNELYENTVALVKETIVDSALVPVKTEAIHTYAILAFFGDASDDEAHQARSFLLDIVASDGEAIDALDVSEPVVAALEAWSFLVTTTKDVAIFAEDSIEIIQEQLSSSSVPVAVASGQAIALVYEMDHREAEAEANDEEQSATNDGDDGQRYRTYSRYDLLETRMQTLAKESGRAFSAAERKTLHSNFTDLLAGLRDPARGPRYSEIQDQESGRELGYRLKLRVAADAVATVTDWRQLVRLQALRRALRDGFRVQWEENSAVKEALPLEVAALGNWRERSAAKSPAERKKGAKARAKGGRLRS